MHFRLGRLQCDVIRRDILTDNLYGTGDRARYPQILRNTGDPCSIPCLQTGNITVLIHGNHLTVRGCPGNICIDMITWIKDQCVFQRDCISLLDFVLILRECYGFQTVSDMNLDNLKHGTVGNRDICITRSNCRDRSSLYLGDLLIVRVPQKRCVCRITWNDRG